AANSLRHLIEGVTVHRPPFVKTARTCLNRHDRRTVVRQDRRIFWADADGARKMIGEYVTVIGINIRRLSGVRGPVPERPENIVVIVTVYEGIASQVIGRR